MVSPGVTKNNKIIKVNGCKTLAVQQWVGPSDAERMQEPHLTKKATLETGIVQKVLQRLFWVCPPQPPALAYNLLWGQLWIYTSLFLTDLSVHQCVASGRLQPWIQHWVGGNPHKVEDSCPSLGLIQWAMPNHCLIPQWCHSLTSLPALLQPVLDMHREACMVVTWLDPYPQSWCGVWLSSFVLACYWKHFCTLLVACPTLASMALSVVGLWCSPLVGCHSRLGSQFLLPQGPLPHSSCYPVVGPGRRSACWHGKFSSFFFRQCLLNRLPFQSALPLGMALATERGASG